jgi:hypothetical protein
MGVFAVRMRPTSAGTDQARSDGVANSARHDGFARVPQAPVLVLEVA